jgi:hypothetical protein
VEASARRLFKISHTQGLKISVLIPALADSKTELDPKIWDEVKSHVTAAWIEYTEEEKPEEDDEPTFPDSIRIFIENIRGERMLLRVRPPYSIHYVMQKLEAKAGFVPDHYGLTYDGQRLDSRGCLSQYYIEDNDILEAYPIQIGGKPVTYLFSNQALDVSVSLHLIPQWSFSAIYPVVSIDEHENGAQDIVWNVHVTQDGTLVEKSSGSEVSYLYWEAKYVL